VAVHTPRRRPARKLQPTVRISTAVRAGGFVFVSGQPGIDPATGEVPGDSFG
jgi:enamine deaminase RidA (YjgF/YER057c/UK114 family)